MSSFHPGVTLLGPGGHACEERIVREATMCLVQADSCSEDPRRPEDGSVKVASPDWDLSRVWEEHLAAEEKNQSWGAQYSRGALVRGRGRLSTGPKSADPMLGAGRKEWKVKKEIMRNP